MTQLRSLKRSVSNFFHNDYSRLMMLFGVEGLLFQFAASIAGATGFGTNLYAINLGATDAQIGMIPLIANLMAVALLLPVGIISDRTKNAKTVPAVLMLYLSVMYVFFGTVSEMGAHRMTFFFIFLALTAGVLSAYNSIWQAFFGDMTSIEQRSRVFAFRSRFVYLIAMLSPVLCGTLLTAMPDSAHKLVVLRVFFYICAALNLVNAIVILKMRGGQRSPEALASLPKFSVPELGRVLRGVVRDRRFMLYFASVMFFYMSWHFDWSVWYISQIQYVGMSEADLSLYTALVNIGQLVLLGVFVRLNERKGTRFTFLFPAGSLMLAPLCMLLSVAAPAGARTPILIVLATVSFAPQCATNLCLVQMLLDAVPVQNRSLLVSIHSMFVMLSNAVLPYLGVLVYQALGSDFRAIIIFNVLVFIFRALALTIFIFRAKSEK